MTKRYFLSFLVFILFPAIPLAAQSAPDIRFRLSVADPLKFPENIHLGEVAGVATDSKGDLFVYTRTGSSDDHDRHFASSLRAWRFAAV